MSVLRFSRRSLARRLLEPGEARFPDLHHHSMSVSQLCWRMAHTIGLDLDQVEDAVLTGLLHDVGMRELDYDRLYRLADPGPEHQRVYRKHVLVGEQIVRLLEGIDHDDVPPNFARLLALCEAARLSCRTGQAESPSRMLAMLSHV